MILLRVGQHGQEKVAAMDSENKIRDLSFDKYFCSPLTRTIETFSIVFPNQKPLFEPLIREHLYHSCDVGRQPKTLKKIYKNAFILSLIFCLRLPQKSITS